MINLKTYFWNAKMQFKNVKMKFKNSKMQFIICKTKFAGQLFGAEIKEYTSLDCCSGANFSRWSLPKTLCSDHTVPCCG